MSYEGINTPQQWTEKAAELANFARKSLASGQRGEMESAATSLAEFLRHRTTDCPQEVALAILRIQFELEQTIAEATLVNLNQRSARIDALILEIQAVARATSP